MTHWTARVLAVVPLVVLASCTGAPPEERGAGAPVSATWTCAGRVDYPQGALELAGDPALRARAVQAPDAGGLCTGVVLRATGPVRLYRVWDASRPESELGSWWSFDPPAVPVAEYRERNAICAEWSALDRLVSCDLEPGEPVVVGPGQSAQCRDGRYPVSATIQVYVPYPAADRVTRCAPSTPWPPSPPAASQRAP